MSTYWGGQYGSALHVASENGHEKIVQMLLAGHGINPDLKDPNESTPLVRATAAGHTSILHLLIEAGANINPQDRFGRTPLSLAAGRGYEVGVELLLSKGADVERKDREGRTALSRAADRHWHARSTSLLLENGAKTTSRDNLLNWTPSMWYVNAEVISHGNTQRVTRCLGTIWVAKTIHGVRLKY
jgi:ankyrin repeat protein